MNREQFYKDREIPKKSELLLEGSEDGGSEAASDGDENARESDATEMAAYQADPVPGEASHESHPQQDHPSSSSPSDPEGGEKLVLKILGSKRASSQISTTSDTIEAPTAAAVSTRAASSDEADVAVVVKAVADQNVPADKRLPQVPSRRAISSPRGLPSDHHRY